jgi:hypothetical protein
MTDGYCQDCLGTPAILHEIKKKYIIKELKRQGRPNQLENSAVDLLIIQPLWLQD